MKKLVIGIGTGRCGTRSLAHLLNIQHNACVTHEAHPLRWKGDNWHARIGLVRSQLAAGELVGDVAFYHLNYVAIYRSYGARIVFLKRPREEVIASYMHKVGDQDHWSLVPARGTPSSLWDASFPKYPVTDKAEAIGLYHDEYYARVADLGIETFPTSCLSTEDGQGELLRQAGISPADMVIDTSIWLNRRPVDG